MTDILQEAHPTIDVFGTVDDYIDDTDWRIKENANAAYSLSGLANNIAGKVMATYWFDKVLPSELGRAHREGKLHWHDASGIAPYCAGWDLREFLEEGLQGSPGKIESGPPKHFSSACSQLVNFLALLSSEWMGAQAVNSTDTLLAPYIRKDSLSYQEVKQVIQEMVYSLNVSSRSGFQSPFVNFQLDVTCPEDLKDDTPTIAGGECDFTYGDLQPEIDLFNTAFAEVMIDGGKNGEPLTFPIPTYNITKDFDWDSPVVDRIFAMTAKYGNPYFQNYIGSDLDPGSVRSMCCRLSINLKELERRGGGLFGSGNKTGSLGVSTLNLANYGWVSQGNAEKFYHELDTYLDISKEALEIKRVFVTELMERGLFPYSKHYLGHYNNHFNTIGILGMNEAIRNLTFDTENIATKWGQEFALGVVNHIREKLVKFQEETGHMYNLEYTPAEGATYRLAAIDQRTHPGIIQAGTPNNPYYTNSVMLPVGYTEDLFEALDLSDELQTKATGGTVFHVYSGDSIRDGDTAKLLVKKVCENYRLPYLSITPTYSTCKTHGYIKGKHSECPFCGGDVDVWERVMGYLRNTKSFNRGKIGEHNERQYFAAGA